MADILVVDDQAGIRLLLKEILERQGHTVHLAADGREALGAIRAHQGSFDLILLDMKLPGQSGLEVLRALRNEGLKVPVIVMSAYGDVEQIHEARRLGVETYLAKPFDIAELSHEVARHLSPAV
ncbi:response regulator [Hydrogenibacillus schlegelii]|uniref:Response regulatory domain-containing protein n=1 Tax=Hydrogenibacillus schlegelii TaxID=1484 RepID=A0A132N9C8_HYDSH|nr:response regulator [Hydrogenibacillus schlegelii]KWX06620.1 hypothetical protein TR75_05325 [Hydrogenibacillus schlegelii]OAR04189.1 hypothetical protein SA87_06970 [Hydrogenibacillus schlegelii]